MRNTKWSVLKWNGLGEGLMEEERKALYWEKANNGKVRCRLCPHRCLIAPGNWGVCGVRENHKGTLYTVNYGLVSALALDPIEKKPLKRFYPGSRILSVGSIGCNLACPFCQNHRIARARPKQTATRYISPETLAENAAELKDEGNIGVAYTYNEPIVWFEYVLNAAKAVQKKKMKNVLVTNGYISGAPLEDLLPYIDAMNIDLKGYSPSFYREVARGGLEDVKKTISLSFKACHVEVTTLVIPGLNDSVDEIRKMAEWLAMLSPDIPLHLSRFFPRYEMKDKAPTSRQKLYELAAAAREFLQHVYIGNI